MNFKDTKFAVVGATGNVGHTMLAILSERGVNPDNVDAVASARSKGKQVSYGEDHVLDIKALDDYDFSKVDIALFSPGSKVSAKFAPKATEAGCVVIDNTSHFRMDPSVPLIVPEVNPEALDTYESPNIIANPNCSTIQMVCALKPLHDLAKVKRVVASTYQSVSGAGKEAMDELLSQTKAIFVNDPIDQKTFPKVIAFNVIPHIDTFMDDGNTKEEWKMAVETQKILDPSIKLSITCVRVPVFIGHGIAVHVEFEDKISVSQARKALSGAPGIKMYDKPDEEGYATPLTIAGEDDVYVSRLRADHSVDNGLAMWIAADNIRKGAALNAVQIAELVVKKL